ncbi:hypothetical protein PVAND_008647 [Polypedilum vanderplanki]|uniref:Nucleoside diphosphate kinase n=1 Tax=Polypedilum vanderplanki TaxID=319348 RepID=A0A9J6CAG2_POLVA|nr:hypothetical protein PVAND_008647 [Polypedilum vanderplanki]
MSKLLVSLTKNYNSIRTAQVKLFCKRRRPLDDSSNFFYSQLSYSPKKSLNFTCDLENEKSRSNNMANNERTFIMCKPDAVQRGIVGEIIKRFETKGFKLVGMKFMWASKDLLEKHYADLSSRPFFPGLVNYMSSGPVVPMVWEGLNAVKTGRVMLGATNPADSAPGTIRGDLCVQVGRNIIHGSDSVESAKKEIALWFNENELVNWTPAAVNWVYE